jgi:hypothetical protein
MYERVFSKWHAWDDREMFSDISRPGVYVVAHSQENLAGHRFSWRREIIYIGMTNAIAGLRGRLRQFDNTMRGKLQHGGADRVLYKHQNYRTFRKTAYVALAPFRCDPSSNSPKDLRIMGDVTRLEFRCLAHFVERFGALPEFNDKKAAPKHSRANRSSRR